MQELVRVILNHYREKGQIFTYMSTSDGIYADFWSEQELETLMKDFTLTVHECKLFGSADDLLKNDPAYSAFIEILTWHLV